MSEDFHHGQFAFIGYTTSYIHYKSDNLWHLGIYEKTITTWATTNGTEYPIGTKLWNISSPIFNGSVQLNLNACNDSTEFNCMNGGCVLIETR